METFFKHIKMIISSTFFDLKYYFRDYCRIIILSQVAILFFAFPLISFILKKSINISGLEGLTESNFTQLLTNPMGVFFFFLFIVVTVLIILMEFTLYIYTLDLHQQQRSFKWKAYFKFVFKKFNYVLLFQSFFFFAYFVLIIPLGGLNFVSNITSNVYLPHFIADELLKSTSTAILYFVVLGSIIYLNIRLSFTLLHFLEHQKTSLIGAMKASFKTSSKHVILIFMVIIFFAISYLTLFLIIQLISILPIYIADTYFIKIAPYIAGICLTLVSVTAFVIVGMAKITFAHVMKHLYLMFTKQESIIIKKPTTLKKIKMSFKVLITIGIISLVINNILFIKNIVYDTETMIIAHRGGDTSVAVENSIEALEAAKVYDPDYIEIDVMETKDKALVLFHDETLARLARDNRKVSDLNLEQLQTIPISANGFESRIPTLEEFIIRAKDLDMKLLLEIKQYGTESEDMSKNILDLLNKYDMLDNTIIQSFKQTTLDQIIMLDPDAKVSLVVAFNIGNLVATNTQYITLESSSVTSDILNQARNRDIKIFVWTVNQKDLLLNYMVQNVDGIITNELALATQIRTSLAQNHTLTAKMRVIIQNTFN